MLREARRSGWRRRSGAALKLGAEELGERGAGEGADPLEGGLRLGIWIVVERRFRSPGSVELRN